MMNACFLESFSDGKISRDEAIACYMLKMLVPVDYDDLTEYLVKVYSDDAYTKFPAQTLRNQLAGLSQQESLSYRASFFQSLFQLAEAVVQERRIRLFGSEMMSPDARVKSPYYGPLAKFLVELPRRLIEPMVTATLPQNLSA